MWTLRSKLLLFGGIRSFWSVLLPLLTRTQNLSLITNQNLRNIYLVLQKNAGKFTFYLPFSQNWSVDSTLFKAHSV